MFQFEERIDIQIGDVLQQKGSGDHWRVYELEDRIETDFYINFEAKVEKVTAPSNRSRSPSHGIVINGPNYGGIQLAGNNSTQHMSVESAKVEENINKLKDIAGRSGLNELDKEDLALHLDRLLQLSKKEKNPDLIAKMTTRVSQIKEMFNASVEIASKAAPYISNIANILGIS